MMMSNKIINTGSRVESIDILRGIVILVMLFVNDIAGVANIPTWLKHAVYKSNTMTFVDLVFPAFLFIVGMSIPFALSVRKLEGENQIKIWKHIILRTTNLFIIGILMVNSDLVGEECIIPKNLWTVLMYLSVILIWNRVPKDKPVIKRRIKKLKYLGVTVLVFLIFIYQRNDLNSIIEIRPSWWGILGLIGWAYLITCFFYIPLKKHLSGVIICVWLLYSFYMAAMAGFVQKIKIFDSTFDLGANLGTHAAVVLSGVFLGKIIQDYHQKQQKYNCLKIAFFYSIIFLILGIFLNSLNKIHVMFIIDKNLATPSWGLISSSFTIWLWMIIYWIIDIKGKSNWSKPVRPAGMNPLFAYILAPLLYAFFSLISNIFGTGNFYEAVGNNLFTGILRSVIFAFCLTWFTGLLQKRHIWLKL